MNSKKSQGLSFSTIVLAVISIFILVLVILFVSRGFTGLNRPVEQFSQNDYSAAVNSCTVFCREAQATASTLPEFTQSRYCTRKVSNGAGLINCKGDFDAGGSVYTAPVVGCTVAVTDRAAPATEADCP